MTLPISGENVFCVNAHSFSISPSSSGYTLAYSANAEDFTEYEKATPADDTLIVNGVAAHMYFKLVGNTDDVVITY